jgi:pyruvate dehydrogenase E2 component (dihydrolipoamide acetyltransferase)
MATAIKIPDIGTTVDQVKLVKWLKQEGDAVRRGEALCEVETDKAVSELESIADGTLLKRLAAEGEEVAQDAVIAYVGQPGEAAPGPARAEEAGKPVAQEARKLARSPDSAPGVPPMIRKLAEREGVDLAAVSGTGPGGRITREDVMNAKQAGVSGGESLSANQVVVARRVLRSQQQIPPIALQARFDMRAVIALRNGMFKKSGTKVCFDAFFIKAAATAMRDFPHFRSRLEGEQALPSDDVHVGVAVGIEHDLYIPVIHSADRKDLHAIDAEVRALSDKAGRGACAAEEMIGATLTVSNLGMFPVLAFDAIIPPDQTAILTVGTTEDTAVVKDGKVAVTPTAIVTLSVNHRLVNGREAAEFLTRVKMIVEQP